MMYDSLRSEKLFLNFPRRLLSASSIELWVVHPEWSALNNAIIQLNLKIRQNYIDYKIYDHDVKIET